VSTERAILLLLAAWLLGVCLVRIASCSVEQYEAGCVEKANSFAAEYKQWIMLKTNFAGANGKRNKKEVAQWEIVVHRFQELKVHVESQP